VGFEKVKRKSRDDKNLEGKESDTAATLRKRYEKNRAGRGVFARSPSRPNELTRSTSFRSSPDNISHRSVRMFSYLPCN